MLLALLLAFQAMLLALLLALRQIIIFVAAAALFLRVAVAAWLLAILTAKLLADPAARFLEDERILCRLLRWVVDPIGHHMDGQFRKIPAEGLFLLVHAGPSVLLLLAAGALAAAALARVVFRFLAAAAAAILCRGRNCCGMSGFGLAVLTLAHARLLAATVAAFRAAARLFPAAAAKLIVIAGAGFLLARFALGHDCDALSLCGTGLNAAHD